MAPSRGKGKSRASNGATAPSRRSTRSAQSNTRGVQDVYQDLLAEAAATESSDTNVDRPLKKRKIVASVPVSGHREPEDGSGNASNGEKSLKPTGRYVQQTVEDFSESIEEDSENETDLAFEDVDLDQPVASLTKQTADTAIEDISVSVDTLSTPKRTAQVKRTKPISAAEKSFRVLVHKAHILCLLGHCMYVNSWCNNDVVQRHLHPLLSKKTISYLNPSVEHSQFQRDRSFMDGLQQASDLFRGSFRITTSGMRRARWPAEGEDGVSDADIDPIDRAEFIAAAKDLEGSQDTANQLFCGMLRSVGVEARLVCSLQVLPFANAPAKSNTPQKSSKHTIYATPSGPDIAASDSNPEDQAVQTSSSIGTVPSIRRRLGQPAFIPEPTTTTPTPSKRKKPPRKLAYPIFWTEAFNTAHQKWIPVDPIVTQSVSKPSKLEPPISYEHNQLTYVFAFEPDGVVRDVTRRYARAYNAKTRRQRVESTPDGAAWLKQALRIFRRRGRALDREQVEDAALARREAREGLPGNVQDFKDHPIYALERHLKRNEVVHPRREVGKVNAGTAAKPRMEAVFRREDVCACRSAEKWFRSGRVVKKGQQAVKRVRARRVRGAARKRESEGEDGGEEDANVMELYALFQTEMYVPSPVVQGRVPRNAYGNLDVYVPSMVPAGGAYIRHQLASQAARILKADYADAVTGFQFRGRQGTAVVEGAVVAEQYAEAVKAIIEGLEDEKVEEDSRARSAMALRVWRRFLTGLKIKERVSGYGESAGEDDVQDEMNRVEDEEDDVAEAGGFFRDDFVEGVAMPTAGRFSLDELNAPKKKAGARGNKKQSVDEGSEEEAESTAGNEQEDFQPSRTHARTKRYVADEDSSDEYMPNIPLPAPQEPENESGGFLPNFAEGEDMNGGGFLPENISAGNEGAGGFLLEHSDGMADMEHEGAGGFVVEEHGLEDHSFDMTEETSHVSELHMGGGFIPGAGSVSNNDQDSPTKPGPIEDTAELMDTNGTKNAEATTIHSDLHGPGGIVVEKNDAVHEDVNMVGDLLHNAEDNDKDTDRGSMLSHDPEDEDAEPDWLELDSD